MYMDNYLHTHRHAQVGSRLDSLRQCFGLSEDKDHHLAAEVAVSNALVI